MGSLEFGVWSFECPERKRSAPVISPKRQFGRDGLLEREASHQPHRPPAEANERLVLYSKAPRQRGQVAPNVIATAYREATLQTVSLSKAFSSICRYFACGMLKAPSECRCGFMI